MLYSVRGPVDADPMRGEDEQRGRSPRAEPG
jgi:hypothetical protein